MLKTACVLDNKVTEGVTSILTMSLLTLNDGKTPDTRLIKGINYDVHYTTFAPPTSLVGRHYKGRVNWSEFTDEYINYLRQPSVLSAIDDLIRRAVNETIVILCIEAKPCRCHRRLFAEYCAIRAVELGLKLDIFVS